MTQLRGKTCLVTGAGGGIGAAIVGALEAGGAKVIGSDRDTLDLTTPEGPRALAAAAGRVDVLVNCAGAGLYGPVAGLQRPDLDKLLALNLVAPIELTRELLPAMLERGEGHIVNVASLVAHVPKESEAAYAATKAGLAGFTRSLHEELRGSGVGVSLISPAVVATGFFAERGQPYARRWPRPIAPERVAEATVRAIERNRAEVIVPRWLTVAARIYGGAPSVYRALAEAAAVATSRG
ncbi:MAG TPA: SDR family NAD(P)-dependent oxidoreductase [Gaiellaceae bacterium]|nr:SDR family NAD(P)-dependent oxidoreductase [Gaiellaceae bacterium]